MGDEITGATSGEMNGALHEPPTKNAVGGTAGVTGDVVVDVDAVTSLASIAPDRASPRPT